MEIEDFPAPLRGEFPGPDGPLDIMLDCRTTMSKDGFGAEPHIYPVTIVQARYGGSYEGGLGASGWLCFPVAPHKLSDPAWLDWNGSDIECATWWSRAHRQGWPIGHGDSPQAAHQDLLCRVGIALGADVSAMVKAPTWDRDELRDRD